MTAYNNTGDKQMTGVTFSNTDARVICSSIMRRWMSFNTYVFSVNINYYCKQIMP